MFNLSLSAASQSILHGSEKAKHEGPLAAEAGGSGSQTGQHSHIVGRGKYVHEVISECGLVSSLHSSIRLTVLAV